MTDQKGAKPRIVDPASSGASSAPHCDEIVDPSMGKRSGAGGNAGLHDDDAQFLKTVLSSLETRSPGVKEALKQALENGEQSTVMSVGHISGLEKHDTESSPSKPTKQPTTPTHPVSGTTTSKTRRFRGSSPRPRLNCVTRTCRADLDRSVVRAWLANAIYARKYLSSAIGPVVG